MNSLIIRFRSIRLFVTSIAAFMVLPAFAVELQSVEIGQSMRQNNSLRDALGNAHLLSDIEAKAIVIAFVGTECPLASLELPKLTRMSEEFGERGVEFVLVYPNEPETLVQIATSRRFSRHYPLKR